MNEITKLEEQGVSEVQIQIVSAVVQEMMAPVMRNIGEILERNNQAMERIAAE